MRENSPASLLASLALAGLLGVGCSQATTQYPQHPAGAPYKLGTYHFEDEARGQVSRIQGTVTLLPDSATIDLADANCTPIHRLFANDGAAIFQCDGAQVSDMRVIIDRWNPGQRSSWSGKVPNNATTSSCTQYVVTPTGEKTCQKYQSQSEPSTGSVGGRLRVVPVTP